MESSSQERHLTHPKIGIIAFVISMNRFREKKVLHLKTYKVTQMYI